MPGAVHAEVGSRVPALVRRLFPNGAPAPLWRLVRLFDPYVLASYAQEGEDMIVRRLFDGVQRGFYVDVGAHHPLRYSNTCHFHRRGWRGINIDADPAAIAEFRRARPHDVNLALGVSDAGGALAFHVFSDPALNTFDPQLAAARAAMPGYCQIAVVEVPVRRLDEILAEHLPPTQPIHLLNVDAEGYDLNVLQSNDWTRYRPRCVLVEARRITLEQLADNSTHRFMHSLGYRLLAKSVNTMIYVDSAEVER